MMFLSVVRPLHAASMATVHATRLRRCAGALFRTPAPFLGGGAELHGTKWRKRAGKRGRRLYPQAASVMAEWRIGSLFIEDVWIEAARPKGTGARSRLALTGQWLGGLGASCIPTCARQFMRSMSVGRFRRRSILPLSLPRRAVVTGLTIPAFRQTATASATARILVAQRAHLAALARTQRTRPRSENWGRLLSTHNGGRLFGGHLFLLDYVHRGLR